MHLQVLSSGSGGNAALVRAGERTLLVDAGLPREAMRARLEAARLGLQAIDDVLVTHGHLDHARSVGLVARAHRATVHCSASLMRQRSVARAKRFSTLTLESENELGEVLVTPLRLPHDADPTLAFKIEHAGRSVAVVTDLGRPDAQVARRLRGVHVLVLEFNHDPDMVEAGPYSPPLKKRILGNAGHLSNAQAAEFLREAASEALHTVVLAHLSQVNNRPLLALAAARAALEDLGLERVRVEIAGQDHVGPAIAV
jgi:phosphoribosyl 1,2-cyclic phosphodiesterase